MGTLLGGTTGLCVLASLFISAQSTAVFTDGQIPLRATSTRVVSGECEELRVIETRAITVDHGLLVYGNADVRDSMVVESRILQYLTAGDIVSDYEGSIAR